MEYVSCDNVLSVVRKDIYGAQTLQELSKYNTRIIGYLDDGIITEGQALALLQCISNAIKIKECMGYNE